MSDIEFVTILQIALILVLQLAAPVLLVSVVVGLVISIFQSVTQIQEATLTFVPKIIAGLLVVIILLPWMLQVFIQTVKELFDRVKDFTA
jgi:flagellar biosynthetic protein FliQ